MRKKCSYFQCLSATTLVSIFGLVILGGIVRVTESGLGCPDWPLCHGRIIPPADLHTLIEYSHRLLGLFVGVLVLITAVVAYRRYRDKTWIVFPAFLGLFLVIVQGFLGGVTVLTELKGSIVTVHLALAEMIIAIFTMLCLASWRGMCFTMSGTNKMAVSSSVAVVFVYILLLSGSYVTTSGSSGACNEWPLCQDGKLIFGERLADIHMLHRFSVVIMVIIISYVGRKIWMSSQSGDGLQRVYIVTTVILLGQVAVGAFVVWTGLSVIISVLHLALATGFWMSVVSLALWPYTGNKHLGVIP